MGGREGGGKEAMIEILGIGYLVDARALDFPMVWIWWNGIDWLLLC